MASCIQPSQPVVTFAIAVLVGQEKLNFNRFMGLTLAVVGAIWVVLGDIFWTGKSAAEVGKNSIFGDLCLIANCLSMGLCYVIMKQLNRIYNPMVVIAWVYSYGSASLIFTSLFMYPPAKSSQQVRHQTPTKVKENAINYVSSFFFCFLCFEIFPE